MACFGVHKYKKKKWYLIQNSQAVKKGASPPSLPPNKKSIVKKDVKSKLVAKKWLWW